MPPYLPVRALNRSQGLRIGTKAPSATVTTYVDLGDGPSRRDLAHHSTLGAIFAVGSITNANTDVVVVTGGIANANTDNTKVDATAVELRNRSTGAYVQGSAASALAPAANATGSTRVDLVVADNTTGAISIVTGTTVRPATPAGKTQLATFNVANATGVTSGYADVRPRP